MPDDFRDDSEQVPVEFNLDAWIDGAQLAQRSVVVYSRPDLYAQVEDVERRIKALREAIAASGDEQAIGDAAALNALTDEANALIEQLHASKATWYLQALSPSRARAVQEAAPHPGELKEGATDAERRAAEDAIARHNCHLIAAAVVRVESPNGSVTREITPEQVERLRERLGERQLLGMLAAIGNATAGNPSPPAPFSRPTSETDRT